MSFRHVHAWYQAFVCVMCVVWCVCVCVMCDVYVCVCVYVLNGVW